MTRTFLTAGLAACALTFGLSAPALAGTVNVSLSGSPLTITQGNSATVQLDFAVWGSTNPNAIPSVSYCDTVTLNADGTVTCTAGALVLNAGQNYTVRGQPTVINRTVNVVVGPAVPCNTSYTYNMVLTTNAGTGLNFGNDVRQITRPITITVECAWNPVAAGCGHGYWKNHQPEWPAGYDAYTLADVFTLPGEFNDLGADSMMTALNYPNTAGESRTTLGKAKILLIQAVAAVLNAVKFGPSYLYPLATVQGDVHTALSSGDKDQIEQLKELYDAANNTYCPLE